MEGAPPRGPPMGGGGGPPMRGGGMMGGPRMGNPLQNSGAGWSAPSAMSMGNGPPPGRGGGFGGGGGGRGGKQVSFWRIELSRFV